MYPIDREEYVNAYLAAMKEEMEQTHFGRKNGSEDGNEVTDRFFGVIAKKLSHWHKSEQAHGRSIPSH